MGVWEIFSIEKVCRNWQQILNSDIGKQESWFFATSSALISSSTDAIPVYKLMSRFMQF